MTNLEFLNEIIEEIGSPDETPDPNQVIKDLGYNPDDPRACINRKKY